MSLGAKGLRRREGAELSDHAGGHQLGEVHFPTDEDVGEVALTLVHKERQEPTVASLPNTTLGEEGQLFAFYGSTKGHSQEREKAQRKGFSILPTAVVRAKKNSSAARYHMTRVLVDGGAQTTFVTEYLANKLKLKINPTDQVFHGLGDARAKLLGTTEIYLQSRHDEKGLLVVANVVPLITGLFFSVPQVDPMECYESLKALGRPMADDWPHDNAVSADVLLGQNYYWAVMSSTAHWPKEAEPEVGPVVIDSIFGLVLQGFWSVLRRNAAFSALTKKEAQILDVPRRAAITKEKDTPLDVLLSRMWDLEHLGIKAHEECKLKPDEKYAVEFLEANMEYLKEERRFQVKIPWNEKKPPLQNNYRAALVRFHSLWKNLQAHPDRRQKYVEGMQKYIDRNHATPVEHDEALHEEVFYLPHSGVLKATPDSSEVKLRIVFDCSAKDRTGMSLNEKMVTGPVPQSDILRILSKWRKHRFAFNLDVKDCFLNIKLHPDDQNKFRFLWSEKPDEHPKIYKFTSLIFGSKCSPWISSTCLWKLLDLHQKQYPDTVDSVKRGLWVDDVLLSTDSVEKAEKVIEQLTDMFGAANFGLAKMTASDDKVLRNVEQERCLFPKDLKDKGSVKALGIDWQLDQDDIYIGRDLEKPFTHKKPDTKRTLCRMAASVFDPLQMLAPWTLGAKLLIRKVWEEHGKQAEAEGKEKTLKKFWDQPLPPQLQAEANEWKGQYSWAEQVRLPRWLCDEGKVKKQELYGFSDASPQAMGCVIYLVTTYRDKKPTVRFVCAKSKINTKLTLPKAELTAARLLSNLMYCVKEYLDLPECKCRYFSDSMISLYWLKQTPNKWQIFVSNAVAEIQKYSNPDDWYYVRTDENPADYATRPQPLEDLVNKHHLWWTGPGFLRKGKTPDQPQFYTPENEEDAVSELRKTAPVDDSTIVLFAGAKVKWDVMATLLSTHSDLLKVLRILRRIFLCFAKKARREELRKQTVAQQLTFAMSAVVRHIQKECFHLEIEALKKKSPLPKKSRLIDLDPYLDPEGLLRVGGRLQKATTLTYDRKHPVILPNQHPCVEMILRYVHESNAHAGSGWVKDFIREKYWIMGGLQTVKKYVSRCVICRKFQGKHFQPKMAPLPKWRVDGEAKCFEHVAMDACGPLTVIERSGKLGKRDILVFSCLSSRAVNLEVLPDRTIEGFCHAMRRQAAEHGLPKTVRLDNYPSHRGTSKEFDVLFSSHARDLRCAGPLYGVTWSWSRLHQPSTNGVVERAVKDAKLAILKTLGKATIDIDDLFTLVKEVKRVINSRPLVASTDSGPEEAPQFLSPHHLLYGYPLSIIPFLEPNSSEGPQGDDASIRKRWLKRQKLLRQFTHLFVNQYLSSLAKMDKWKRNQKNPQIGDLCIIFEPNKKRKDWPLGRIEKLHPSPDGQVRTVTVRTSRGMSERSVRSLIQLRSEQDKVDEERNEYNKSATPKADEAVDPERNRQQDHAQRGRRPAEEFPAGDVQVVDPLLEQLKHQPKVASLEPVDEILVDGSNTAQDHARQETGSVEGAAGDRFAEGDKFAVLPAEEKEATQPVSKATKPSARSARKRRKTSQPASGRGGDKKTESTSRRTPYDLRPRPGRKPTSNKRS